MVESDQPKKVKKIVQVQIIFDHEVAQRVQAEEQAKLAEEEGIARFMVEQKLNSEAAEKLIHEQADALLAQNLYEQDRAAIPEAIR